MSTDTPESRLAAGDPAQALVLLQAQVRANPGDARLRIFLFQLLCLQGAWERAWAQLAVCGELDAACLAMVNTYREAIRCEAVREAVFAGKTSPVVFGQPTPWLAWLIEALAQSAQGHDAQAQQLRHQALALAPATAGTLNGEAFEWLADADSRLGPVLEVVLQGRYTWMPLAALSAVQVDAPADLRDMVWAPAHLWFTNGGDTVALIPTCYAGTRPQASGPLKMARATEWLPRGAGQYAGLGQRVWATSGAEVGLLDVRELKLQATT